MQRSYHWFLVTPGEKFYAVLQDAELRKRFAEFGLEPLASTPATLGKPMASEIENGRVS
jgi:hypothetical protein